MDWQPIETAPSTRLLLHLGIVSGTPVMFTGWKAMNGRIYADSGESVKATHWMPLPEPPEQNGGDE